MTNLAFITNDRIVIHPNGYSLEKSWNSRFSWRWSFQFCNSWRDQRSKL